VHDCLPVGAVASVRNTEPCYSRIKWLMIIAQVVQSAEWCVKASRWLVAPQSGVWWVGSGGAPKLSGLFLVSLSYQVVHVTFITICQCLVAHLILQCLSVLCWGGCPVAAAHAEGHQQIYRRMKAWYRLLQQHSEIRQPCPLQRNWSGMATSQRLAWVSTSESAAKVQGLSGWTLRHVCYAGGAAVYPYPWL